jgi:hypothetical protein
MFELVSLKHYNLLMALNNLIINQTYQALELFFINNHLFDFSFLSLLHV